MVKLKSFIIWFTDLTLYQFNTYLWRPKFWNTMVVVVFVYAFCYGRGGVCILLQLYEFESYWSQPIWKGQKRLM